MKKLNEEDIRVLDKLIMLAINQSDTIETVETILKLRNKIV